MRRIVAGSPFDSYPVCPKWAILPRNRVGRVTGQYALYLVRWNHWNHVRAAASFEAAVAFTVALL